MKNVRMMSVYELKKEIEELERKVDYLIEDDCDVAMTDLDRLATLTDELYERY